MLKNINRKQNGAVYNCTAINSATSDTKAAHFTLSVTCKYYILL